MNNCLIDQILTFDSVRRLCCGYKGHDIREGPRPRIVTRLDTELVLSPLLKLANLVRCGGAVKDSNKAAGKKAIKQKRVSTKDEKYSRPDLKLEWSKPIVKHHRLTNTLLPILKTPSFQVVETSVTNNSSFQSHPHPHDHINRTSESLV